MEENNINGFTFFKNYYYALEELEEKDKRDVIMAIIKYVFENEEPKFKGIKKMAFSLIKPSLDLSKRNSRVSKKNNDNETESTAQSRRVGNVGTVATTQKRRHSYSTSISYSISYSTSISNFINNNNYSNKLKEIIDSWYKYKLERKEKYTEIGFNNLLSQIRNNISKYGEERVIDLISVCMANNYKGIIFQKLKEEQKDVEEPKRRYITPQDFEDE